VRSPENANRSLRYQVAGARFPETRTRKVCEFSSHRRLTPGQANLFQGVGDGGGQGLGLIVGRGPGVGGGLGVGLARGVGVGLTVELGVAVAVGVLVAVGVAVAVGVGEGDPQGLTLQLKISVEAIFVTPSVV
jgi:hypothetical protein